MLEFLQKSGPPIRFVVAATGDARGSISERFVAAGAELEFLPLNWQFARNLRGVVRQHNVTAIHTHSATASGYFMLLAWVLGVKVRIAHFRSDSDGRPNTPVRVCQRWLLRNLIRGFATRVLAVSPAALSFAGPWTTRSNRASAIPSGIAPPTLPSRESARSKRSALLGSSTGPLLVHIGRDRPEKNRRRAISVLSACRDLGLDARLAFLGRASETEVADLRSECRRLGLQDHVSYVGQVTNPGDYICASDVTLVTSTREGLPGVVLESVALGTPVVSSDLPGALWIADSFPGAVTSLSLTQSDQSWAKAVAACAGPVRWETRSAAREAFDESIFSMPSAAASFHRIWSGQ